tara:strand:+ start:37 stop:210 length:174 start_codon:yes stop_codon:yes gene_type:complete
MLSLKFGKRFDEYLSQSNYKAIEQESFTRTKNGKVLVDFDDYQADIVDEYKSIAYEK